MDQGDGFRLIPALVHSLGASGHPFLTYRSLEKWKVGSYFLLLFHLSGFFFGDKKMKFLLLFFTLFFSSFSYSYWEVNENWTSYESDCSPALSGTPQVFHTPRFIASCVYSHWTQSGSVYAADVYYWIGEESEADFSLLDSSIDPYAYDGVGMPPEPDPSDYDDWCDAIKPTFITVPDGIQPPSGTPLVWESGGCEFTSSGVWIQEPSGNWSATVLTAEALVVEPVADDPVAITDPPISDGSSKYTPTSDPSLDCPFSNFSYDGQSYCYSGSDAPQGEEYADTSTRVNHYDGSYTVTDSSGTSVTYNPDGSLQGTASTSPGSVGPGTSNDGCPPWAPSWMCTDSTGEPDTGTDETLPVESINATTETQSFNSGLATTGTCPAPQVVTLSMMANPIEVSYQGFCDFASAIRALVLAAAYMSATFLAYRGLT